MSDPTVGHPPRRSTRRNTSPTALVDRDDHADFRSTYMQSLGGRQLPRDRARDLDLQTVENARNTGPEQHPGSTTGITTTGPRGAGTVDLIGRVATAASVPVSGCRVSDSAMLDVGPHVR